MKPFDYPMLQRISKRVIDNIALLRISNKSKYQKQYIENWVTEFRTFNQNQIHDLINCVFQSQCESMDESTASNVERIHIPVLGYLKLNHAYQDILFVKKQKGSITDEEVKEIIDSYIAKIELLKLEQIINVDIKLKTND